MSRSSIALRKIEKEIMRKLSDIFLKHYPYDELMRMVIVRVELKSDYSTCTIYYDVLGDDSTRVQIAQILQDIRHDVRRRLGRVLRLRRIPQLIFREAGINTGGSYIEA